MRSIRRVRRPLVALLALLVAVAIGYTVRTDNASRDPQRAPTTSAQSGTVALSALPAQAADTVAAIERGGPFPYPRNDGVVFHNNERRLPSEPDGYYREYTVRTPGSDDRGARRIIAGRDGRLWYTGDHYATFRLIDVER